MFISKFTTLLLCVIIQLSISYADTNGIWTYAEDIEAGVFGADENNPANSNYTFDDIVYFNKNIFSEAQINAQGDITTQNSMIGADFIDIEDSNYFLNPSGVSNLYDIEANRYYSSDGDTNYYLDPSRNSRVNNLEVVDTLRVDNIIFGDGVIVGSGSSGSDSGSATYRFGGIYTKNVDGVCRHPNFATGSCSCPSGYSRHQIDDFINPSCNNGYYADGRTSNCGIQMYLCA